MLGIKPFLFHMVVGGSRGYPFTSLFSFSKRDQLAAAGGDCPPQEQKTSSPVDLSSSLGRLPIEIMRMICVYLSPAEFINLALTSHQFYRVLFEHCSMDISTAYPHLFFIHRTKGLFRGSWFSDRQVLKGIPIQAFFKAPICVLGVKAVICLEDDIEQTMSAALALFPTLRFSSITLEVKKRLPPSVTPRIFDIFLLRTRCGFVRFHMSCPFRLQDVPNLDRACFIGETWDDKSDESWRDEAFKGRFVILQELPNLKIIENTLKQFLVGNLVNFFHAFSQAPGASLEIARLSVKYGQRIHSAVAHTNGFRTITFKAGPRRLKISFAVGEHTGFSQLMFAGYA